MGFTQGERSWMGLKALGCGISCFVGFSGDEFPAATTWAVTAAPAGDTGSVTSHSSDTTEEPP